MSRFLVAVAMLAIGVGAADSAAAPQTTLEQFPRRTKARGAWNSTDAGRPYLRQASPDAVVSDNRIATRVHAAR